jgi:hypothetical protein
MTGPQNIIARIQEIRPLTLKLRCRMGLLKFHLLLLAVTFRMEFAGVVIAAR